MTVELPRWPLADRLTLALAAAAGVVLEAVMALYPGAPVGAGVAVATVLLAWQWQQRRWRPQALEFTPTGGSLRQRDGRDLPFVLGPGSRLLGTGVVLHWRAPGRSAALWLTPADLPRELLRRLAVRLVAARTDGQ
jgi:hypothetical protein